VYIYPPTLGQGHQSLPENGSRLLIIPIAERYNAQWIWPLTLYVYIWVLPYWALLDKGKHIFSSVLDF
jgi:hypothetical protein